MHGNDDVLSINMNLIVTSPVLHHTNTVGLMLDVWHALEFRFFKSQVGLPKM